MSQATAMRATADFREGIRVPLEDALHASVHILGRSGLEACKHAVILMAQSARKITKQAKKNRKVERGANGRDYIEVFRQSPKEALTIWLPEKERKPTTYANMVAYFKPIKRAGLAKSSWFWGGAGRSTGGDVPQSDVKEKTTSFGLLPDGSGWELVNKLAYITHPNVLPSGWEADVSQKAANRIMHEVSRKVFPAWTAEMRQTKRAKGMAARAQKQLMQLKPAA